MNKLLDKYIKDIISIIKIEKNTTKLSVDKLNEKYIIFNKNYAIVYKYIISQIKNNIIQYIDNNKSENNDIDNNKFGNIGLTDILNNVQEYILYILKNYHHIIFSLYKNISKLVYIDMNTDDDVSPDNITNKFDNNKSYKLSKNINNIKDNYFNVLLKYLQVSDTNTNMNNTKHSPNNTNNNYIDLNCLKNINKNFINSYNHTNKYTDNYITFHIINDIYRYIINNYIYIYEIIYKNTNNSAKIKLCKDIILYMKSHYKYINYVDHDFSIPNLDILLKLKTYNHIENNDQSHNTHNNESYNTNYNRSYNNYNNLYHDKENNNYYNNDSHNEYNDQYHNTENDKYHNTEDDNNNEKTKQQYINIYINKNTDLVFINYNDIINIYDTSHLFYNNKINNMLYNLIKPDNINIIEFNNTLKRNLKNLHDTMYNDTTEKNILQQKDYIYYVKSFTNDMYIAIGYCKDNYVYDLFVKHIILCSKNDWLYNVNCCKKLAENLIYNDYAFNINNIDKSFIEYLNNQFK